MASPFSTLAAERSPRDFRRIAVLMISLITVPTLGLLAVGILMLVFQRQRIDLVLGILVVTVVVSLIAGSVLTLIELRRAARLSALQSDFVSKVSHELRTPLTSIRLFVEGLRGGAIPAEELDACMEALDRETARLSGRIERLLDWGRMEAGMRSYTLEPLDGGSVVEEAVATYRSSMVNRKLNMDLHVEPDLPTLRGDREALVDALVNLLANADKYQSAPPSQESPVISLRVRRDGDWLRMEVEDKGIGIPHTEHRRIFQKFYRVDERLTNAAKGSGLGLAMVRHIVAGHRGRIELDSEPGRGSTFSLLFPLDGVSS